MANRHRGEVDCRIGGRSHALRLTLGALAEIESAFGVESLAALGERLAGGGVRARDLIALLGAALRGGGAALTDEEVAATVEARDLPQIAEALGRVFALAFGAEAPPARPPQAR